MSSAHQHPDTSIEQPAATESAGNPQAMRAAQERTDTEEDRRRQQDLDFEELGGES
jgi:hypothetical protein